MNIISRSRELITAKLVSILIIVITAGCQQAATNPVPPMVGPQQATARPEFSDEQIRQQVAMALNKTGIKASIDVEVKNRLVALKGEVTNLGDRMRIVEAAKSVPGVKAIVRYIDVKPLSRSNSEIEKDIRDALKRNPATREIDPVVSVNNGSVTLGGTGSDWQVKFVARRLVENVKGVREVLNPTCFPYDASPDYSVKEEIVDRLAISRPAFDRVSVEVNSGRVLLKGSVLSLQDKLRAISAAYVDRVRSVSSGELLVDSMSAGVAGASVGPSDEDIKKVIEIAFAHDPRVASSKPRLVVSKGIVTLTGSTFDLKAISIAGLLAKQMPGVKDVQNNLSVRTDQQLTDNALTVALREAFLSDPNVDLYQLEIGVDHGRATLSGNTNTQREKWRAEEIAMSTRGIVAINNRLNVLDAPEPKVISYTFFPSWEFTKLWWMIPVADAKAIDNLKADVERQIDWSPFTDSRTTTITTKAGMIVLSGTVSSELAKKAAEDAAYEAGAPAVENQLVVEVGSRTVASRL